MIALTRKEKSIMKTFKTLTILTLAVGFSLASMSPVWAHSGRHSRHGIIGLHAFHPYHGIHRHHRIHRRHGFRARHGFHHRHGFHRRHGFRRQEGRLGL